MELFFQKLIKTSQVAPSSDNPSRVRYAGKPLYKLDWTGFHPLPQPYEEDIHNMRFVINAAYLDEINRTRANAITEWARGSQLPFDTVIREACLKPGIAFAEIYIKLTWDCAYESGRNAWESSWLENAMLYKLWLGQTGGGCVPKNAKIEHLKGWAEGIKRQTPMVQQKLHDGLEKFVATMEQFRSDSFNIENGSYRLCKLRSETYTSPFTGQKN